jgi:hypothetical protein
MLTVVHRNTPGAGCCSAQPPSPFSRWSWRQAFPWPTDPGVAYIEHQAGALYLEEARDIEAHTVAFEHTCVLALSPDESATMIRDAAEEFS